ATEVANGLGIAVALVEQTNRVAGRRSTPAAHLLLLWTEVVKQPRREGAVVPHQESARETTVYGKAESRLPRRTARTRADTNAGGDASSHLANTGSASGRSAMAEADRRRSR